MKTCVYFKQEKLGEFTEGYIPINSPNVEITKVTLKVNDTETLCFIDKEDWIFEITRGRIEPIRNFYLEEV